LTDLERGGAEKEGRRAYLSRRAGGGNSKHFKDGKLLQRLLAGTWLLEEKEKESEKGTGSL